MRVWPFVSPPPAPLLLLLAIFLLCACAGALLNVTSRWFFGLIRRRLAAAVTSLYCKENSESEQEGGWRSKKKKEREKPSRLPTGHTSGASTHLMHRTRVVFNKLTFLINLFIPRSFMVYAPGGQKWRPTCTGSEVCIPMWTFHHTHTHTRTHKLALPLASRRSCLPLHGCPLFPFRFPKAPSSRLCPFVAEEPRRVAVGKVRIFTKYLGAKMGQACPGVCRGHGS